VACGGGGLGTGPGGAGGGVRRALADAAGGGLHDQVHGLWVDGRIRRPRPTRERRVNVVTLTWYAHVDRRPADLGTRWLELCRRHYPAALPHRFGATEPLPGRLDRDGDAAFAAAVDGTGHPAHTDGRPGRW
jgi:hypothetical protein